MGKLVISEFMTLDGVMADPHLWQFPYWSDEQARYKSAELEATGALLLGRATYELFAGAWPQRKGDPFADRFNALPKHVVSATLTNPTWENSSVVNGDLSRACGQLKEQYRADIVVHGSHTLLQHLVRSNLVDEYHLLVYPIVLGSGIRVFADGAATKLELVQSRQLDKGAVLLTYRPAAAR